MVMKGIVLLLYFGVLNRGLSQARSARYDLLKQDPSELQLRVSHEVTRVKFPHPIVDCVIKLQHPVRLGVANDFRS